MDNSKQIKNILYIGSGYVGALSAITMAVSNPDIQLTVFDINKKLIDKWNEGSDHQSLPFFEP